MKLYKILLLLSLSFSIFGCHAKDVKKVEEIDIEVAKQEVKSPEYVLESGVDFLIESAGEYTLSGVYTNTSIIIVAGDDDKVYLILDGLEITNQSKPVIYLKSGDNLYIETTESLNSMSVTETFQPDGETNLDAVIFSRSDIDFSGAGSLTIESKRGNGISSKDDIVVTGGELSINSYLDGLEANDSITINDGLISINSKKDGIHSEYDEDPMVGMVYINGGEITLDVTDDAIYGHSEVWVTGGKINVLNSYEGLESTKIYISGGEHSIYSSDDGINAVSKNGSDVFINVSGGITYVEVGQGDTDAFDSNGDLIVSGGEIHITTPRSAFDADGQVDYTDGLITINGVVIEEIEVQRFGRGKRKTQR